MCGILGAISECGIDESRFRHAVRLMHHRGPDSDGYAAFMDAGLVIQFGFTRLAVRDTSNAANQPFCINGTTIVFNGEVYNTEELKTKILRDTVQLKTHSDTEILLYTYSLRKADFETYVRGMFALAVYDSDSQSVLLSRDRFGIKPLYFLKSSETLYFASEIRSLLTLAGSQPIDIEFLRRGLLLDPFVGFSSSTPFKGVVRLEAGSRLHFDIKSRKISVKKYYDPSKIETDPTGIDGETIRSLLHSAVDEHLLSDVPVASALSGGFDSSLLSVIGARQSPTLKTFFVLDMKGEENTFNQDAAYAETVFRHMGRPDARLIHIDVTQKWTVNAVDEIVGCLGEPIMDDRAIVWLNLYRSVRSRDIVVAMNGQGADELWYGYYPRIWKWFSNLYHTPVKQSDIVNYLLDIQSRSVGYSHLSPSTKSSLPAFAMEIASAVEGDSSVTDGHKRLTLFMLRQVLASLLRYEDAMSMLASIEVRVPFLDHRFVELALRLPSSIHLGRTLKGKDYLKEAFESYLPESVVKRDKSPLPKYRNTEIFELAAEHMDAICLSPLVNELFDVNSLKRISDNASSEFYGSAGELLVQVFSTWRFEEVFNV